MISNYIVEKNINEYVKRYAEYVLRDPEFYKKDEGYKYRAVATFQKHFNMKAKDLHAMLKTALSDARNLIESGQYFPKEMILRSSKRQPEFLRKELAELLDRGEGVGERIDTFIRNFNTHHQKYKRQYKEYGEKTYFDYRFISFLLAAYKPEKYFYTKYDEFKKFAEMVGYPLQIAGSNGQRYQACYEFAAMVREVLNGNQEFKKVHKQITEPFEYKDSSLSWGTTDFIFNVARRIGSDFDKETKKVVDWNKKIELNKKEELEDALVDNEIVEQEGKRSREELLELVRKFKPSKKSYIEKGGIRKVRQDDTIQKERVKQLENYECQICGFTFEFISQGGKKRKFAHADHIIDKSEGGTEEADNIWILCPNCHAKKTLGVITVEPQEGKILENKNDVCLHHNNHLSWYRKK